MAIVTAQSVTLVLCMALLILLPSIRPIHAQTSELNSGFNNTLTFNIHVALNKINLEDKIADIQITPEANGNNNYQLFVNVPHTDNTLYNFTKEKNNPSNWYDMNGGPTLQLPYTPLNSDYWLNPWPVDEYHVDVFVIVNKNVTLSYQKQQDIAFAQDLTYNKDWNATINPKLSKISDVPDFNNPFASPTVFDYEIIISHTENYQWKSAALWLAPLIVPMLLITGHFLFVIKKDLGIQVVLFTGIVIISITSLLTLRSLLPPDLTIIETTLLYATISYASGFFVILYKRRNNQNIRNNSEIRKKSLWKKWMEENKKQFNATKILSLRQKIYYFFIGFACGVANYVGLLIGSNYAQSTTEAQIIASIILAIASPLVYAGSLIILIFSTTVPIFFKRIDPNSRGIYVGLAGLATSIVIMDLILATTNVCNIPLYAHFGKCASR